MPIVVLRRKRPTDHRALEQAMRRGHHRIVAACKPVYIPQAERRFLDPSQAPNAKTEEAARTWNQRLSADFALAGRLDQPDLTFLRKTLGLSQENDPPDDWQDRDHYDFERMHSAGMLG